MFYVFIDEVKAKNDKIIDIAFKGVTVTIGIDVIALLSMKQDKDLERMKQLTNEMCIERGLSVASRTQINEVKTN